VPIDGGAAILIGSAGPAMFTRFARERDPGRDTLDAWCREVLGGFAAQLRGSMLYPFDKPALPFQRWARRAGAGHASPLGLNIHPVYGLWHAYRGLLVLPDRLSFPDAASAVSPCETCADRPCLTTCPVGAFTGSSYDVGACAVHVASPAGTACRDGGCLARLACPVGRAWSYGEDQLRFHMAAFVESRTGSSGH